MDEKQKNELKNRTLQLKISDNDCEVVSKMCGMYGITLTELLECFVYDLTGGVHSGGSDEEMIAENYFERRYSMMESDTMLNFFLSWDNDIEDYITAYDELAYYKEHPEEYKDEVEALDQGEKLWFEEALNDYQNEYLEERHKESSEVDFDKETEIMREYLNNLNALRGNVD